MRGGLHAWLDSACCWAPSFPVGVSYSLPSSSILSLSRARTFRTGICHSPLGSSAQVRSALLSVRSWVSWRAQFSSPLLSELNVGFGVFLEESVRIAWWMAAYWHSALLSRCLHRNFLSPSGFSVCCFYTMPLPFTFGEVRIDFPIVARTVCVAVRATWLFWKDVKISSPSRVMRTIGPVISPSPVMPPVMTPDDHPNSSRITLANVTSLHLLLAFRFT